MMAVFSSGLMYNKMMFPFGMLIALIFLFALPDRETTVAKKGESDVEKGSQGVAQCNMDPGVAEQEHQSTMDCTRSNQQACDAEASLVKASIPAQAISTDSLCVSTPPTLANQLLVTTQRHESNTQGPALQPADIPLAEVNAQVKLLKRAENFGYLATEISVDGIIALVTGILGNQVKSHKNTLLVKVWMSSIAICFICGLTLLFICLECPKLVQYLKTVIYVVMGSVVCVAMIGLVLFCEQIGA